MKVTRSKSNYHKPNRGGRTVILCIAVICALAMLGTAGAAQAGLLNRGASGGASEEQESSYVQLASAGPDTSALVSASDKAESAPPASATESAAAPVSSSGEQAADAPVQSTPGTAEEGESGDPFFDNAVFIGDSRTQALETYGVMRNATYFATKGLMVNTIFTKESVKQPDGSRITILDALGKGVYDKIYLMLGVNELGWGSTEIFVEKYGEVIDAVREKQPDAQIYVQSILPVTSEKSNKDKIYNNSRINSFNAMIEKLTAEHGATYVPVNTALMDSTGALPKDASTDGVHPNKDYCKIWMKYLRSFPNE